MIKTSAKLAMYLMGRSALTEPPLSPTEEELINETEAMEEALRGLGGFMEMCHKYFILAQRGIGPSTMIEAMGELSEETKQILEDLK